MKPPRCRVGRFGCRWRTAIRYFSGQLRRPRHAWSSQSRARAATCHSKARHESPFRGARTTNRRLKNFRWLPSATMLRYRHRRVASNGSTRADGAHGRLPHNRAATPERVPVSPACGWIPTPKQVVGERVLVHESSRQPGVSVELSGRRGALGSFQGEQEVSPPRDVLKAGIPCGQTEIALARRNHLLGD